MVFLYIYMNYFGIRYKLEKFMFEFILKFLIVFYIICGYLCINKKKRKNFCFFLIFLGLLKRKLIIKVLI